MFLPEKFSPKPTKDSVYFGIDLGTTYTLVATVDSSEVNIDNITQIPVKFISYKQISPIKHGGEIVDEKVASIIAVSDGKPFCGSKLYELKGHEEFVRNQNIFYHWKLDLGIDRHPLYPDAVSKELDIPAKVAGKVLNFCRIGFTKSKETRLYNAVITVPASFQMNQRKDVIEASALANIELSNQMLIDEPNAAFIGYFNSLSQAEKENFLLKGGKAKKVLVFDIGGGTCDLSILEI
ncbi:MAG: Hsp70 family protein, partial [Terrimonas sp.]|nr:Hsp70 family protein [Terrimonas sp.]